jgi:DNA-3-methyladenine glycosylase II
VPLGPFSLEESAMFGFGQRSDERFDGVMRLAFCVDGDYRRHAGVEVRQDPRGVHCTIQGEGNEEVVLGQVARMLSLDHDGEGFARIGDRDAVIGRLQAAAPGLRPPLFHSPYEAAAWAVLSARRPREQMATVRRRLGEEHGTVFRLAGEQVAAFPTPDRLVEVDDVPGLNAEKVERLHGVARAALEGQLDVRRLLAMDPADAMRDLQSIRGLGPFYSALVVIRGTGFTDVLPEADPQLASLVAQLYGLDAPPSPEELRALAEPWRPFRTWAAVLIRAAARRVLA